MTGDGNITRITVLSMVFALLLAFGAVLLVGIDRHWTAIMKWVGIPTIPPADPSRAYAKLRGNVAPFFGSESYPVEALDRGQQGSVRANLTVAPTGAVSDCRITRSSGSQSLDRATCDVAMQRVRFEPARGSKGEAVVSTYRLAVRWVLPDG